MIHELGIIHILIEANINATYFEDSQKKNVSYEKGLIYLIFKSMLTVMKPIIIINSIHTGKYTNVRGNMRSLQ